MEYGVEWLVVKRSWACTGLWTLLIDYYPIPYPHSKVVDFTVVAMH